MNAAGHGGQSEWKPLRRVIVRAPGEAFGSADPAQWHYTARPDLARARDEHAALVRILESAGAEVLWHDAPLAGAADAIYVYDPVLITDRGGILLSMGKPLRSREPAALGAYLEAAGIPVLGRLEGEARAEAGDTLWLDEHTLAVGLGFRTNAEGARQLAALLAPGVTVLPVALPYFQGPDACLHLKSLVSLLDQRLAVVHRELLPVPLYEALRARDVDLVVIPAGEFATQASNILALGPRDVVMLEGNPLTRERLERSGCRVRTYRGDEISLKAEGGPTCLTRPALRR